jgi:DsbC/DsbD-like thiol-disulfide interchange protein
MKDLFGSLLMSLNMETADLNQYIWNTEMSRIEVETIEIVENESIDIIFHIELLNGWKGYYNNEENGGNHLQVDILNNANETINYSFPDPQRLHFLDQTFAGYNENYSVPVKVENLNLYDTKTPIQVNVSFCKTMCVPNEFIFSLEN